MRLLTLMFNRIRQYYRKNRFLFILFVLGGILNAVVFCYFYGNLVPAIQNRNSNEIYYRQYVVELEEECDIDEARKILDDSGLFESTTIGRFVCEETEPGSKIYTYYEEVAPYTGQSLRDFRRLGDISEPVGNEIISDDFRIGIGNTVTFCGEDFVVKGKISLSPSYISSEAYERLFGNRCNKIYAVSRKNYAGRFDYAGALFNEKFSVAWMKSPEGAWKFDRTNSKVALFFICICYGISEIAFALLLLHIMESCVDENIISRIVGAPKHKVGLMALLEGLILSLFSAICGILLHVALTPVFFKKINVYDHITYNTADYIKILLMMFLVAVVVIFFVIRRFTKVSPVEAKRKYS